MKKSKVLFTTLIILLFISTIHAQEFFDGSKYHEETQITAIFASRVNLRESPNIKSKVLSKLELGELIEVVERTNESLTIDGKTDYWYKVKTGYYTGYLWGRLLAKYVVRSTRNPSVVFMLKKNDDEIGLRVKVVKNNTLLQDEYFKGLTVNEQMYGFYNVGAKGINGVHDLLAINYLGEFCGAISGQTYLAWNGSTLNKFIEVGSSGEASFVDTEWVVFPSDLLGEKNLIHLYHEEEEYIEDESGLEVLINERKEHRVYRWDGEKLVEVK